MTVACFGFFKSVWARHADDNRRLCFARRPLRPPRHRARTKDAQPHHATTPPLHHLTTVLPFWHQQPPARAVRPSLALAGALALRGRAVAAVILAAGADEALVHGGLDGVVLLDVELGQLVILEHARLLDVTGRGLVHDGAVGLVGEKERRSWW